MRILPALGCFGVLSILAGPAAAAMPLDGGIDLEVFAKANGNFQEDPFESQSWFNFGAHPQGPKDLGHITFDPEAKTANGKIDVKGHGDLSAHWASADAGSVTADIGRTIALKTNAPQMSLLINSDWEYSFLADENATFNLDYSLAGQGDLTGLGAWFFEVKSSLDGRHYDEFEDVDLERVFDGSLQHAALALKAGRTYSVSLVGLDHNRPADGKDLSGAYHAQFDWSIVPVPAPAPEPSSWLLMITGFGLAGGRLRRRRALAVLGVAPARA